MSQCIEIANPAGKSRYTSLKKAREYVSRGRAVIEDGKLCFIAQERAQQSEGRMIYWNGARARFINGEDVAMYPPGCNVAFKPPNWIRQ